MHQNSKLARRDADRPPYHSYGSSRPGGHRPSNNSDPNYKGQDKCSMYKVKVAEGSKVYRYNVQLTLTRREDHDLTERPGLSLQIANKMCCYEVVRIALAEHNTTLYVYDGGAALYLREKIDDIDMAIEPLRLTIASQICVRGSPVQVSIQLNMANPTLDYSDFTPALRLEADQENADRSTVNFIELLTTQAFLRRGGYQVAGPGLLFETTARFRQAGFDTVEGLQKGARALNSTSLCLVFDVQRSLFYQSRLRDHQATVAEILQQTFRNDYRAFEQHYRQVRMELTYAAGRTIRFGTFTNREIRDRDYYIDGQQSIPDYLNHRYNLEIDPKLRGCRPLTNNNNDDNNNANNANNANNNNNNNAVFPMDGLHVLPNQQVPQHIVPENLLAPINAQQRYELISRHVQNLTDGEGAHFLAEFGVTVVRDSNDVKIMSSQLPMIRIGERGREKEIKPRDKGDYFNSLLHATVLIPQIRMKKWLVGFGRGLHARQLGDYVNTIRNMCEESGMDRIPEPQYLQAGPDDMEQLFKDRENDYIFYIDNDRERNSHARLKLFEAMYKILTQHVVSKNLKPRNQTLKNVVFKMNSKRFGLNFAPRFDASIEMLDLKKHPDLLVIGLDVAHPTRVGPQREDKQYPSVVGISSNKTDVEYAFTPDFFYQESRQEEISSHRLTKAIKKIVEIARKQKKVIPKRLFIFRDGVSEGQYNMVITRELEAIREGYEQAVKSIDKTFDCGKLKINLVIATKRHHKRFFREVARNSYENTRVGDFIVRQFTREDIPAEFWLQSHNPIRGTAQLTQYAMLRNDMDLTPEQIRTFILCLSNMHQVSGCPTSLPLPVYAADETAARGLMIYNELRALGQNRDNWPDYMEDRNHHPDIIYDFDRTTELLSYSEHYLGNTRFNS
ncbi:hypothetical protein M3Y94_00070900 [Aphelenchoides besseyi]|nr:hypothetical protein M3Y94_00070900 [Aphelenchoides besseyi]KAI6237874.1 hypothetical protein M3Y95_00310500 [Aphelenchoides besseyi]